MASLAVALRGSAFFNEESDLEIERRVQHLRQISSASCASRSESLASSSRELREGVERLQRGSQTPRSPRPGSRVSSRDSTDFQKDKKTPKISSKRTFWRGGARAHQEDNGHGLSAESLLQNENVLEFLKLHEKQQKGNTAHSEEKEERTKAAATKKEADKPRKLISL
mmetsp:Transcript_27422/g.63875  ORF Transcript_27422/g.63875 Transcript_27422/m.63875 type:complete len:168 (+) Transcript_27422:103-606(+)